MDVSIIIPVYSPDVKTLSRVIKSIKSQKYKGKIELLKIDKKLGFSKQMNIGIKKSKYEIVVIVPQDCIPADKYWLKNLIDPFKDKKVVASVSKVELPEEIWNSFSYLTKGIMIKEKGIMTSMLDGKGGAYRKSTMKLINFFDEENFRTAGEDYDAYVKIKYLGKISYPDAKIIHYHPTNLKQRLRKNYQYANGYGTLVRIHKNKMVKWYAGLIKAIPILGLSIYIVSYPYNKGMKYFPAYLISSYMDSFSYMRGFWKGFLMGKQTV